MFSRMLASLAVLGLAMSLAACSKNADQSQAPSSTDNQSQVQQPSAANEQPSQSPSEPAVPPADTTSGTSTTAKPSASTATHTKAAPARTESATPRAATTTKPRVAAPIVVPSGTVLTVRLDSAVGSKSSNAGDRFTASVADPVEVEGKVVIPRGAEASGIVHEAVPAGRLKGGSKLRISLDRITVGGKQYTLQSSAVEQAGTGRGKRTAVMGGGGAAVGALIGGLTGGGKGAAIGALVGGGAGTAGAAYTGKRDIELPAETALSFKLTAPVEVR